MRICLLLSSTLLITPALQAQTVPDPETFIAGSTSIPPSVPADSRFRSVRSPENGDS